jgi:hypothetical protein
MRQYGDTSQPPLEPADSVPARQEHRAPAGGTWRLEIYLGAVAHRAMWGYGVDPVPPEYSIVWLTCAIASRLDAVMVGWPGAAQDRLPADVPGTRRGCPGIPRRQGEGC